MRSRAEIEKEIRDGLDVCPGKEERDMLIIELLLDLRDLWQAEHKEVRQIGGMPCP